MKTCKTCHIEKPITEFRLKGKYYLRGCKVCALAQAREWSKQNPGKRAAYFKKYREKYVEKDITYRTNYRNTHRDEINQKSTAYRKSKPHVFAAHAAKRVSIKLHRTPKWLTENDKWMIKEAYELAALRTKLFGFSWHVDHVIPLQGKLVSGLNTPYNLQVISGVQNQIKKNRFEVTI